MRTQKIAMHLLLVAVALLTTRCNDDSSFYSNVLRNDVFHQLYAVHDYDFLWVLDNSASMVPHRAYVRDNMQTFLTTLNGRKAVDFQMAVTTIDYFTQNGELIANPAGLSVVKSATSRNAAGDMVSIIDNIKDSPTSFWEQGLESTYQALLKHGTEFSRPNVPLIIVYLTDGDDWSCKTNCWGPEPENNTNWTPFPASRYINYFSNYKSAGNTYGSIFPIVALPSSTCSFETIGNLYIEVANAVGNLSSVGGICSNQIPDSFENIAKVLANRGISFPLSSTASGQGINVYVDGKLVPYSEDNGWVFDKTANAVVFTGNAVPSNDQRIEVAYNQKTH